MSDINERLLLKIKEENLSYGDLAQLTGIPKSALQRYATGETKKIPLDRIELLAQALGTTASYLLGWTDGSAAESQELTTPLSSPAAAPSTKGNASPEADWSARLNDKDLQEVRNKASQIKDMMMASVGLAFDGQIEDEETLGKVMAVIEESMLLAKREAKQKYTPKKYRK